MSNTITAHRSLKLALPLLAAVALLAVLTVSADANGNVAKWQGTGLVLYAGPSLDPAAPTTTQSEFKFSRKGVIRAVDIKTSNELVIGLLGDGFGGGAVTECKDRSDGSTCERLNELLTNAQVTSFHNSEARLRKITQHTVAVTGIGDVEVLSGNVRGNLEGVFTISDGVGGAVSGSAALRIGKGSTATYACFFVTPETFVPSPLLEPCVEHTGGQLFPILLDVYDKGKFEVGNGSGTLADIESLSGKVHVNAQANLLFAEFGGTIEIPRAKASLVEDDEDNDDEDDD